MSDIIRLLPDNIANQIAAGEVIQRPSSAVKELLENSVDAGADDIRLIIAEAGKALVQVVDNGKGMSAPDARMCFERHATSKITGIEDLFKIRTMGFRGEALASIAAVAQVEVRTRREQDELGTFIEIENSQVRRQEPCACPIGTSMAMKNLFFNVPARRNFLRSNASEMRHIVDEFMHVALAFPEIRFQLIHDGQELHHLTKGSLRQRIVQLMGAACNARLVPVKEETDYLCIHGFIGKPEAARKTRGDQYFFVNGRYIRSSYLNHAVTSAFQGLLPEACFPLYLLFITIDPSQIDINVHPNKQEVKFDDERIVYAFVQSAVKHALAQYSVTPSMDFELDAGIQRLEAVARPASKDDQRQTVAGALFQGFTQRHAAHRIEPSSNRSAWQNFYEARDASAAPLPQPSTLLPLEHKEQVPSSGSLADQLVETGTDKPFQVLQAYIVAKGSQGLLLFNQQLAHERILYERYQDAMTGMPIPIQRSLFPAILSLPPADAALMEELCPELRLLGYEVESAGDGQFRLLGTPSLDGSDTGHEALEGLLESYKHAHPGRTMDRQEKLIRSLAARHCLKAGRALTLPEMQQLISELSRCRQASLSPGGLPTYLTLGSTQLDRMFFR
ncbi:MAG: DNA mismatch repair endonuclease MutL [Bacteroidetes bacterium]|nr:DNA mismatch repair endonuclease MutL [Bacteroidota bacterium]